MAWLPKVLCQDETKVNTIIKFEIWKQRILIWKSIKKIYNYLSLNYKQTKTTKMFLFTSKCFEHCLFISEHWLSILHVLYWQRHLIGRMKTTVLSNSLLAGISSDLYAFTVWLHMCWFALQENKKANNRNKNYMFVDLYHCFELNINTIVVLSIITVINLQWSNSKVIKYCTVYHLKIWLFIN